MPLGKWEKVATLPNSSTCLLGLLGYPVRHSISPQIHNAAFRASGLNWLYLAFAVEPAELKNALPGCRSLQMVGVNITVPHKEAVVSLVDGLSPEASMIGAVNTIHFQEGQAKGYNTDGRGFVDALREEKDFKFSGKKMFLIGAGGAGRAVAVQSALEGVSAIYISDLNREKAEDLCGWVNRCLEKELAAVRGREESDWEKALSESDLVINATPVGLHPEDPPPLPSRLLSSGALVVDLIYNPPVTRLLKEVERSGREGMNGLGMLVHQAALAWEIWTGKTAPVEIMRKAAEEALSPREQNRR